MKTDKLMLNLYLLAGIVHIYCVAAGIEPWDRITKYLLMPILAFHVIASARQQLATVTVLLAAIVFSWFGDVLLMYTARNENYFLFGLIAFLMAHVFYIFSFRKYRTAKQQGGLKFYWYLPAVIYSAGFLYWLLPWMYEMQVPVIVYTIVITLMAIFAISRSGRTGSYSFIFVLTGAIAFIASDSIIAVNRFAIPVDNAGVLIMSTYIIAQYLIVTGCLLHIKAED